MHEGNCYPDSIPIVDFAPLFSDGGTTDDVRQKIASDVVQACSRHGFLYVKNSGIPGEHIETALAKSRSFFRLPLETKRKYKRPLDSLLINHGWCDLTQEKTSKVRPGDLKECFDVSPQRGELWPDDEVQGFKQSFFSLYDDFTKLGVQILDLIALGLKLEDPEFFTKNHKFDEANYTQLRALHYPPQPDGASVLPGQIRCGEHTDYGSLTLLIQDEAGGLEAYSGVTGDYVPVTPIPGTVVVNIGDLLQRWTADKLLSTKHRVVNPEGLCRDISRWSLTCFLHPLTSCVIECVDGSNKYPPTTSGDYLLQRYHEIFGY